LHFDKVGRHPGADIAATGVHEVDDDELACNQIIVEQHTLILMRAEGDIGEISCSRTGGGSPRAAKVTAPRSNERGCAQE
jgi:hypothetical protein